ncbi:uncharacterized protein CBL_08953 [Carabus blaptoides fortunei]
MENNSSTCATCHQAIQGKILTALGNSYHPEHFVCGKCKQPITGSRFQEHDGQPYCEHDYAELFSKRCHACKKPIREKVITALGHEWHEEHFVCALCKKRLAGQSFYERNGQPYCKQDFLSQFADRCTQCGQPIQERAVLALDGKWHQDCFKCAKCGKPVTENSFQVEDGRPICSKCAA